MILRAKALLFDLDGTLIDSLPAVNRAWTTWCSLHNLDATEILPQIHGKRAIDSIRHVAPHLDSEVENLILRKLESEDTTGIYPLPGAIEFTNSIPDDRWCVVTSGTSDVGMSRLNACGFKIPRQSVFGEEVRNGKPSPDPYLLGVSRLGFLPSECIGFEDTYAGLQSVQLAGLTAIAVGINREPMIFDYHDLSIKLIDDEIELTIKQLRKA